MIPTVTIGLPFFNAAQTLEMALASVIHQDFREFELILVDDGSTDGSTAIARRLAGNPRVRLIEDGRRLGLAPRLNQITTLARGEYIARMDADDVMFPSRLRRQVGVLRANPAIDVVGSAVYLVDGGWRIIGRRRAPTVRICRRLSYIQLPHPTVMGRREWFLKNPYSSEFLRCEDAELWIRTAGTCHIMADNEPLLFLNRIGTFGLSKTLATLRQYAEILRLYRTRMCRRCYYCAVVRVRVKTALYRFLWKAGLWETSAALYRVESVPPEELRWAEQILYSIRAESEKLKCEHNIALGSHASL